MTNIDKNKPVLVTGATGYVAGWLVKKLLEESFNVHAPIRNSGNKAKTKYLQEIADKSKGTIQFFEADLLKEGSYAKAMEGCEVVFHTASPFKLNIKNPQKELVDPAKLGTKNVLEQASNTNSVKRVVLTSSCVAIYGDNADIEKTPNGIFTEEIWNTSSTLKYGPYSYSKTLAEKEAWSIHDKQNNWDLVVINPSLVVGPGINPYGTSESFNIIKQLGDGSMKSGVPRLGVGVVDVRDLAEAHFKAAFTESAKGRFIVSGHNTDFVEMSDTLLEKYGNAFPIPRKVLPKWLVWIIGPFIDKSMTRKWVSKNLNIPWKGDNSKSKRELGMTYRPLKESMTDFFQQMIDNDIFEK